MQRCCVVDVGTHTGLMNIWDNQFYILNRGLNMEQNSEEKKKQTENEQKQEPNNDNKLLIPVMLTMLVPVEIPPGPIKLNAEVNGIPTIAIEEMTKEQREYVTQSILESEGYKYAMVAAQSAGQSYIHEIAEGQAFLSGMAEIEPVEIK